MSGGFGTVDFGDNAARKLKSRWVTFFGSPEGHRSSSSALPRHSSVPDPQPWPSQPPPVSNQEQPLYTEEIGRAHPVGHIPEGVTWKAVLEAQPSPLAFLSNFSLEEIIRRWKISLSTLAQAGINIEVVDRVWPGERKRLRLAPPPIAFNLDDFDIKL